MFAPGSMKRLVVMPLVGSMLCLASCTKVSIVDQAVLGQTAMLLNERGAYRPDCTLVGHVEKGRSLSNSTAGGGCASCH